MYPSLSEMTTPLEYIPVRHACGDFEIRLMRWYGGQTDRDRGYADAQSPCSTCSPQGRPQQVRFSTLAAAQTAAAARNATQIKR